MLHLIPAVPAKRGVTSSVKLFVNKEKKNWLHSYVTLANSSIFFTNIIWGQFFKLSKLSYYCKNYRKLKKKKWFTNGIFKHRSVEC